VPWIPGFGGLPSASQTERSEKKKEEKEKKRKDSQPFSRRVFS